MFKYVIDNLLNERHAFKYRLLNFFSKKSGIDHKSRFIVSLTTYSDRFDYVYLAIESLMQQKIKAAKIILWISREDVDVKGMPKRVEYLERRGLDVRIVDENVRSYKKLVYSAKEFKDWNIVTCDDDTIYPFSFFSEMLESYKKNPDCVIAYRCRLMKLDSPDKFSDYSKWEIARSQEKPSFNLMPTGVGGVLYPPKSLNEKVIDKSIFMELAPTSDDVWFKAMTLLNGKRVAMVHPDSCEFPIISWSQKTALSYENVDNNKNNLAAQAIFDYFDLHDYIS